MHKKKKVVILGIYLRGIYPPGDNEAVAHLLGPAMLKSAAEAVPEITAKYDITLLNLPAVLSEQELVDKIMAEKPDMVAFSVFIWNFELIYKASQLIHKLDKDLPLVFGGPEVSNNTVAIMEVNPQIKFILTGSGETRFRELLLNDMDPKRVGHIPGITYRDDDGKIIEQEGNITEDLTRVPSPYKTKVIDLDKHKRNCVFIETFRGCIFKCGYCAWMGEQKVGINEYPLEQILEDIDIIYNHPNVASVVFTDACLFYTRERAKIIIDRINACKRKIPTILTLDIAFINPQIIEACKKLDLSHQKFHFGLQSVNQDTLKKMDRKRGVVLFEQRVALLREIIPGAEVSFDLIFGLPGDTHDVFRETVDFSLSLSPVKLNFSPLILLPGSPYWRKKEELGFDYLKTSPHYVKSNYSYTEKDMAKTKRLVLGVIMIMYFPAVRETIYALTKLKPELKRIDIIEEFIQMYQQRSGIIFDYVGLTDEQLFSAEVENIVRKRVMNAAAQPKNCLLAHQTMLELLEKYDAQEVGETVKRGIEYYSEDAKLASEMDSKLVDSVKVSWVVADDVKQTETTIMVGA